MSTTAIAFLLIYFAGLGLAIFRHPRYGLYAYLFAFYMHPPDRWWSGQVPELRWALIAGIVTLVAMVKLDADQGRDKWYQTGAGRLLIAYTLWMVVQYAWAITGDFHTEGVELFAKYCVLFFLVYRLVDSEEEFRNFFLAHVLGAFYLGWLAYGRTVHGRLEGMGGPGIDDANTFGMHISTAAVFGAALLLRGGRYIRLMMVPTLPFILNGMILTQSRGAFLGLVAAALAVLWFKPPTGKTFFYSLAGLGVALFLVLSPPDFIERLKTIVTAAEEPEEVDRSAASRFVIIEAQWLMAKEHPLGTGHRGTRVLSPSYISDEFLTKNEHGEGMARSSHNTLMTVLVDQGFPGLAMYLGLIWWAGSVLMRLRRTDDDELPFELATYRMALAGALALVLVSGLFSNFFKAEVTIWCLALLASLQQLAGARVTQGAEAADAGLTASVAPEVLEGARRQKPAYGHQQQRH